MGKRIKWLLAPALILVLALAVAGCGSGKNAGGQTGGSTASEAVTVVGSTALQPLVEQAATEYMNTNPRAQIEVQGGGSGTGLSQVAQGAATIGDSDIFAEELSGLDAASLVDHRVCVVGMAAVVNPKVKVDNLTGQQLVDIFTGKITNWQQVGGPNMKIVVIHRPKGSGTRATFDKFALGGAEETAPGMEQDSSGTVRKMVAETPGAISYLALSYVDNSIRAVKINGVQPTVENIVSGKYPVWAYEHMYTRGKPTGAAAAFLNYMVGPQVQNSLVPKMGYIPVTQMKVERDAQGKVTRK